MIKFLKSLSVVLACLVIFGSFGANFVTSASQYDKSPLQNTYHKLKEDKELTIGYIGGSVTVGAGLVESERNTKSWRALTTKWFKTQFSDATINEKCMAIGNTGSVYAVHRMEKALLTGTLPDLVFIETAINDTYDGLKSNEIKQYYESIIKKIYAKNPKCDIVVVITGDVDTLREAHKTGVPFRPEHREIAAHYNIPVVDVGTYLYAKLYVENGNQEIPNSSNSVWKKYIGDVVHPNEKGYSVYAEKMASFLQGELVSKNLDKTVYKNATIPNALMSKLFVDAYDVDFSGFDFEKNDNFTSQSMTAFDTTYTGIVSKNRGDTFAVKFTGKTFMLWSWSYTTATSISYSIDGGKEEWLDIKINNSPNQKLYVLADNLSSGTHTIKITHRDRSEKVLFYSMFISGGNKMGGLTFIDPDDIGNDKDGNSSTGDSTGEDGDSNSTNNPDNKPDYDRNSNTSNTDVKCTQHNFGMWKDFWEGTCTEKGIQRRACLKCGYSESRYTELGEHKFQNPTIVTKPTIYSLGSEEGKCIHCGENTQQDIPCSMTDIATQVYFETEVGVFAENTELSVKKLAQSDSAYADVESALNGISGNFLAYGISAVKDGASVQPEGSVTATFPMPDGFGENTEVYIIDSQQKLQKLETVLSSDSASITVTLTQLGTIAICNPDKAVLGNTDGNQNTLLWGIIIAAAVVLIAAVVTVLIVLKKKKII